MAAEVRRSLLHELGLPPQRVHTEVFTAGPPGVADVAEGSVRLRHRGIEHTVHVTAGESVLDAGLRAGMDLPYSCRAGACGICSATLRPGDGRSGDVRSAGIGSVVRTCRTGPLQDAIIDFDAVPGAQARAAGHRETTR